MRKVMQHDWRTLQMFIDDQGVYEVEVDSLDKSKLRCTCPAFQRRNTHCVHTAYVAENMVANNGHYQIHIPQEVDEDLAENALADSAAFREFIIRYAKVEVL